MNILQHRANSAMEKIKSARSPQEKHLARQEGFAVKADLEKFLADENAIRAFKAAQPRSVAGFYKGAPRYVFMVPAGGKTQTAPVMLPDGTKITPVQNQIPVPENMVQAMTSRGWVRANSVITELDAMLRDTAAQRS